MKKVILFVLACVLFILAVFFGTYLNTLQKNGTIVGGDRDEYGCILSAGYSWCEVKGRCIRPWEEECTREEKTSPLDTTYTVEGTKVTLVDGQASAEVAPGSASTDTYRVFGEPVYGDLDNDNDTDAVLYLTKESGGSGSFFYAVVAVRDGNTFTGTNALFLGDRIAPQNVAIDNGNAVFNYAVREPGEAMTTQPSVGKSLWVHYDPRTKEIGELVKDFEGEADANTMKLTQKTWVWRQSTDGLRSVTPNTAGSFSLTFKDDASVAVGTDCNNMGGNYSESGKSLSFGQLMSTLMYCDGSQEGEFSTMLSEVHSFEFTSKGELLLKYGESGTALFQ
jgi:heat shock protein HslJ